MIDAAIIGAFCVGALTLGPLGFAAGRRSANHMLASAAEEIGSQSQAAWSALTLRAVAQNAARRRAPSEKTEAVDNQAGTSR